MCFDAFRYIDIGNAVSVGQQKTLVADIFLYAFQAASGLGMQPGIYHGDFPVLRMVVVYITVLLDKSTVISQL